MKTKKFGKLLSLLLALALMVGMMPATALAASNAPAPLTVGSGGSYATVTDALTAASNGDTIALLDDITESVSYTVSEDKTVTIDGNNNTITGTNGAYGAALELSGDGTINLKNITFQGGTYSSLNNGAALLIGESATITVADLGGVHCISGDSSASGYPGLALWNQGPSVVTVTSATGTDERAVGVRNEGAGTVNVGTASTTAEDRPAIFNIHAGTVNADSASVTSGTAVWQSSYSSGTVNVRSISVSESGGTGVDMEGTGSVNAGNISTVVGASVVSSTGGTVNRGTDTATLTLNKGAGASCVLDSITVAKTGTTTIGSLPTVSKNGEVGKWYTDEDLDIPFSGTTVSGETTLYSTFYVKPPATLTAGTGGAYPTVTAALTAASDGDTIKLLSDMTETSGIVIDGKNITFDLNGKTLDVTVDSGAALTVKNGGNVATQGTGALNVTSGVNDAELGCIGVWVYNTGSSATVTSAKATGHSSRGAYAVAGGSITVTGDVTATGEESFGAYVTGNGEVAVIGNVSASGDQSVGVAAGGGTVDVNGSVSTSGGTTGVPTAGVTAQSRTGATITVDGNVTVDGTNGTAGQDLYGVAAAGTGSTIQIGGAVTVSGNYGTGAAALEGGIVTVNGDVSANAVGAEADKGSGVTNLVTIKGKILTSGAYVKVGGETKTTADAIQGTGTDLGYNIFTVMDAGTHTVRVAASGSPAITSADHTSIPARGGTFQVTATGTAPLTYSLTGAPYGVSINSSTGLITMDSSCRMHAGTDKSFTVTVSNGAAHTATQNFTLTIRDTPYIQMAELFGGKVGEVYSTNLAALGSGTITWSISSGTLPAGLSLSGNAISGTPTTAGDYTFVLVATNANGSDTGSYTITIKAASTAGGSGGSGGGGSSVSPTTTPNTTLSGSTVTTSLTPTVSGGKATASVTNDQMSDTLKKAQAAAGTNGTPSVDIQISGTSGASSVGTTIPHESMQSLVSGGVGAMTISGSTGSVSFDAAALKTISGASGDVTVTVAKTESSTLSDDVKKVVGNHPVYEFNVTSGGKTISEFGGDVTVSVPYTPAPGEDPEAIIIYYIAADGTLKMVPDARYDASTGRVVFTTTHFSTYAIGYNKVSFSDVADTAWYSDAVSFLAARDITSGTTATTFGPNTVLTRGQFITMLLKAYGVAPNTTSGENFADAGNTYYTGYLASAKALKISDGIGGNLFAPDKAVTRQEMFTMLDNALKAIHKQPEGTSGKALSDFSDASDVASWATAAMSELTKTGTISGNGGKLSPTKTTTRAEMAQVLYNLLGK